MGCKAPRVGHCEAPFGISQIHAGKVMLLPKPGSCSCIRNLKAEFLAEAQIERRMKMKKTKISVALLVLSVIFALVFSGCQNDKPETDSSLTCSITVTAADVLENKDLIDQDKLAIVPEDGIIYKNESVAFEEGANLYDVLTSELEKNGVHYEAQNGSYIVAFGNIYASDCQYGGWLYKVNGVEPTVGCNEYTLSDGDVVEFFYVCDYNAYYGNAA